jgi:sulfoxide reductase heme-binding subunit YedZ
VYAAAAAGVVHYWWLVKADIRRPRNYAVLIAALLLARAWLYWRARPARQAPARS